MNLAKKAISAATSAALVASLLATVVAPAALANTGVTSVGTFLAGTTSTGTGSFVFTENAIDSWSAAGGKLIVTLTDHAGASTLGFVGPVTLTAPGSLGATVTLSASGAAPVGYNDQMVITATASDPLNVEQITAAGWTIQAASGAAVGTINATLSATPFEAGLFGTTATATGTLQAPIVAAVGGAVNVLVTSTCPFATTGGLNTTINFSDASDPVAVSAPSVVSGGIQNITLAATTLGHPFGTTVTQTVAVCAALTSLASPGTIGVAAVQDVPAGATSVNAGENNQAASPTTLSETASSSFGYIPVGTLTFALSPAGAQYSTPPSVGYAGAGLAGGAFCTLSPDRSSCSVAVTSASTALGMVTLENITLDVASSVANGSSINVTITSSPAITVSVTANTIAIVARAIIGVSAQPIVYINYNDQQSGMITLKEQGPGFFSGGTGSNNRFEICADAEDTFTRLPYAVVTVGDLKILSGVVGATSVQGVYDGTDCVEWTVYSASTVASTIEIRGADASNAVLPSGALNGPRLSVPPDSMPGAVIMGIWVYSGGRWNLMSDVSNAVRAFKSGVVVTALSQPVIPAGSPDSLGGNLKIDETLNGQFKSGEWICVTILPRSSNFFFQDTKIKSAVTNDLPMITTNTATGLLADAVAVPGCAAVTNGLLVAQPTPANSFSFEIHQQAFGGTLGSITISNIHYLTTADAPNGPVLVDVAGWNTVNAGGGTNAVDFETTVSNARIGSLGKLNIGAFSALGLKPTTGYTTSTPKYTSVKKYVTWKFTGGTALAGQRVNILVAKNIGGVWGGPKYLKSAWADANGIVTFAWTSATAAGVNVRVQFPGGSSYAVSTSAALGAYFK